MGESAEFLEKIRLQARQAVAGLLELSGLKPGQLLVVGGSSSEVLGKRIGSATSPEVAGAVVDEIYEATKKAGVYLAVQGCEHINRAVAIEREAAEKFGFEIVSVWPIPGAGGAMASAAMERFKDPVVVEEVKADAGMDIGDALIGMQLKRVAVPVRLQIKEIGHAHLTLARTRPKLIGGERAVYKRPQ